VKILILPFFEATGCFEVKSWSDQKNDNKLIERYLDNLNFILKTFSPEINHCSRKSIFTVLINTNHPVVWEMLTRNNLHIILISLDLKSRNRVKLQNQVDIPYMELSHILPNVLMSISNWCEAGLNPRNTWGWKLSMLSEIGFS